MKKRIIAISLLLVLVTVSVSASNKFELEQVFYPIYSDGNLVPEDELPTLSYNDRTYVPLRKLSEATGLEVYFDGDTESIHVYNEPLNQARISMSIADIYHDIGNLEETFYSFHEHLSYVMSYKDVVYFEERRAYIDSYIPNDIQEIESKINALKIIFGNDIDSVNSPLMIDLNECLSHAKSAYNYAQKSYEYLGNYLKTGSEYYYNAYYGNNKDGYVYKMMDEYDSMYYGSDGQTAESKYDFFISLAMQ